MRGLQMGLLACGVEHNRERVSVILLFCLATERFYAACRHISYGPRQSGRSAQVVPDLDMSLIIPGHAYCSYSAYYCSAITVSFPNPACVLRIYMTSWLGKWR